MQSSSEGSLPFRPARSGPNLFSGFARCVPQGLVVAEKEGMPENPLRLRPLPRARRTRRKRDRRFESRSLQRRVCKTSVLLPASCHYRRALVGEQHASWGEPAGAPAVAANEVTAVPTILGVRQPAKAKDKWETKGCARFKCKPSLPHCV